LNFNLNYQAAKVNTESNTNQHSETLIDESNHVTVQVISEYLDEQSDPERQRFVHAYHVTITNDGKESAQLLNRHWLIIDGNEEVQEVQGEGVIGQQPMLEPGESYKYTSGTIIKTQVGCMHGSYEMLSASGDHFMAAIPPFTLATPGAIQ
jgi:ApaG protein